MKPHVSALPRAQTCLGFSERWAETVQPKASDLTDLTFFGGHKGHVWGKIEGFSIHHADFVVERV